MKSDIKIVPALREAVQDYVAGVEDRFGGTKLSTVLAVLRVEGLRDMQPTADLILEFLTKKYLDCHHLEKLFIALSRIVKTFELNDTRIAGAAELLMTSSSLSLQPNEAAQLLDLFVASGGDLTPKVLINLSQVKNSETRQWVYFAVNYAFVGDVSALAKTFRSLLNDHEVNWKSIYIIDYIDDIHQLYKISGLNMILKSYAENITSEAEKEELYSFYQDLTGRDYRPQKTEMAHSQSSEVTMYSRFLRDDISKKLSNNPTKASRAIPFTDRMTA
ncbi:hypothetical protein [Loktanella sp. M215]|uniref:hypothetical protein n=1 Tax=Loktanella sp. M215 TaxID=2675431 RepID=UPI001F42D900|nr:hypothetical protein [Loktanella sp. M215]MCF7698907.1 hypothetical protein [Loktanella sp. M215]